MTEKERSLIESLCRQIEAEQDRIIFTQLVQQLQGLIGQWLSEVQLAETRKLHMDGFVAKVNGNGNNNGNGHEPNLIASSYEKIIDDAVAVMRSDYASLQMLFPERGAGGELRLLAFRGFSPQAAKFWGWVRADSKSTCGMALRTTQRVVAPDIATCDFMAESEDRLVYLQTGIHACQTTPLISRAGNVVGMISTHWRRPHQPSGDDFGRFDKLASEAAELIASEMQKLKR